MKILPILLSLATVQGMPFALAFHAVGQSYLSAGAEGGTAKKDDVYRAGKLDIDAGRWGQAIDKFSQVARQGGSEADAALYWKAYAETKAGRPQQALATLKQLASSHPKSAWLDDGKALEVEIRGGDEDPELDENEELKLYALNGLLAGDPDRAVPMLQKFLRGNHSPRLKEQALFVLSQAESAEARKTLLEVARGSAHPELQRKAIEYLGVIGEDDEEAVKALDEIYRTHPQARGQVLDSYLVAERTGRVLAIARDAKDPLRGKAIDMLGAMEARNELRQLYRDETSPGVRMKILGALGVAEDVETLAAVARQEQDLALRRQAIHGLGISDGAKAGETLRNLYGAYPDVPTRKAVIEALMIQDNARALIEIFKAEKNRELRREIVQHLSHMDSEEVEKFLAQIYDN